MRLSSSPNLLVSASDGFADWLQQQNLSLAFTTYQTNRLFCVGTGSRGQLALHERLFDKPMGLFAKGNRLYLSTRYQIWQMDNLLGAGEKRQGCDRLYAPKLGHTTGDLNVHDIVIDGAGELLFVNTDFSCLARLSPDYSFAPVWQPPFITQLVAEDRCHLNGLAMREGQPAFMTACSATDTAAGWRDHRIKGGIVLDIQSNSIVAQGLSMPHSPRWYGGKLWLLNSGTGELGHIDLETGTFVPLTFCPGFVRGLAFHGNIAFVGLSKLRPTCFTGLALEKRLQAEGKVPHCGLMAIDLSTGKVLHWLYLEGVVEELFDVVVLPQVKQPQSLGFQSDEIERFITFPGSGGIVTTNQTIKRPSLDGPVPRAGIPRGAWVKRQPLAASTHKITPNAAS
jgi:protein O-GlcNAc transferase